MAMIQDMLKSPDTNSYQEREMADNRPRKRQVLPISLSESQLAAIDAAAKELGMNRSEYIRHIFMQTIENFPDDLAPHGSGLNKSKEL